MQVAEQRGTLVSDPQAAPPLHPTGATEEQRLMDTQRRYYRLVHAVTEEVSCSCVCHAGVFWESHPNRRLPPWTCSSAAAACGSSALLEDRMQVCRAAVANSLAAVHYHSAAAAHSGCWI